MHDPRFDKLANLLVNFSTKLKPNERVLIDAFDIPAEMTIALIRAAREAGALPMVQTQQARVGREMALGATDKQFDLIAAHELARMKKMDAYIRSEEHTSELQSQSNL